MRWRGAYEKAKLNCVPAFDRVLVLWETIGMKDKKRPKLPRGLHWAPKSQYISFNWRDSRGKQHGQSTHTTDPAEALIFKLDFLKKQRESLDQLENATENLGTLSLQRVSEMYFNWKRASSSANTICREQRMLKNVLRFFGSETVVRSISLAKIRQYQQTRRTGGPRRDSKEPS